MEAIIFFGLLCLAGIAAYILPSFVAWYRGHRNESAIVVLNLFLGWTFIGWVVALVWSFTDNVERAS